MTRTIRLTFLMILALLWAACTTAPAPEPDTAATPVDGESDEVEAGALVETASPTTLFTPTVEAIPAPSATPSTELPATSAGTPNFRLPQGQEPGWLEHGAEDPLPQVAFSPTENILATGHRDGRVLLWDPDTGRQLRALDRPVSAPSSGEITALAFSPDGALLAAARPGLGAVDLWQVSTGEFEQALEVGQGVVEIAFSPDGRRLASAIGRGQRPQVIVWDTESWTAQATLEDVGPTVAFTEDGSTVVTQEGASLVASAPSTDPESAIVLWDFGSGQQGHRIPIDGFVVSVDYHAGHNLVAVNLLPVMSEGADSTPRTVLLDATSGTKLHSLAPYLEEMSPPPTGPDLVALSPDGSLLAVGYQPDRLDLRQVATGKHVLTLRGPADWLRYPVFSRDGALLAASSSDGRILLWRVSELTSPDEGASVADPALETAVCTSVPRPAVVLARQIELDRLDVTLLDPLGGAHCTISTRAYGPGALAAAGDALFYARRDQNGGTMTVWKHPFDGEPEPLAFTTTPAITVPWFGLAVSPDGEQMVWATFDEPREAGARYRSTVWFGDLQTETKTLLWQEDAPDTLPSTIEPLHISPEDNLVYFARRPYGIGGRGPFPAQYSGLYRLSLDGGRPEPLFECDTPFAMCLNEVDFERRLLAVAANEGEQPQARILGFDGTLVAQYAPPDENYVGHPIFGPQGSVVFITADLEYSDDDAPLFRAGAIRLLAPPYAGEPQTLVEVTETLFGLWHWLDGSHLVAGDWSDGQGLALLGVNGERIEIPQSGTSTPLLVLDGAGVAGEE